MLLSPNDVIQAGLIFVGVSQEEQDVLSENARLAKFRAHYGSSPLDIADIWFALQAGDVQGAALPEPENTEAGFRHFMSALHFLWAYPKNSLILASRMGICERYSRGKPLWKWVKKIAMLKEKKIFWNDSLSDPNGAIFVTSIDDIDCKIREPKHPTMNVDRSYYSKKKGGGLVSSTKLCFRSMTTGACLSMVPFEQVRMI